MKIITLISFVFLFNQINLIAQDKKEIIIVEDTISNKERLIKEKNIVKAIDKAKREQDILIEKLRIVRSEIYALEEKRLQLHKDLCFYEKRSFYKWSHWRRCYRILGIS